MYNTVLEAVLAHEKNIPGKIAVVDEAGRVTYRELAALTRRAANVLWKRGVREGDRVMIAAAPGVRYVAAYLALHYVGAIALPFDRNAAASAVAWMERTFDVKHILFEDGAEHAAGQTSASVCTLQALIPDGADEAAFPARQAHPDAIATIIFTSGTTGEPKGVMLSNRNIRAVIDVSINGQSLNDDDRVLIPLPLHHVFGMRVLRAVLLRGATVVLANGFSSVKILYNFITMEHCTGICCNPAALALLYQQTKGELHQLLGSLRYIYSASAPLPLDMKKRLLADLPVTQIINSYGSTEAAGIIYIDYRAENGRLDSIGKPAPGVAARIVDDQYRETAGGREHPGRLAIRGDVVMAGYWQNGKPSRETIVDGWLITSDVAYIEDGFVYLLGRADDMINTGGKKTAPVEIENAVSAFPGVSECCCVAAPDAVLGSVPVVFVVPHNREEFREEALYRHLAGMLEKYKMPRRIIPLDAIPKNHMGKYERKKLTELLKTTEEER